MGVIGLQDHVKVIRRARHQGGKTRNDAMALADPPERQHGNDQPAQHQQGDLHDIGQRHGLQSAPQLVGQREDTQPGQRQILIDAGHLRHRDRSQPQDRGEVDRNIKHQPEHGHHRAQARTEAGLEKLRHGRDAVLEKHRQKQEADDQQRGRGHPFVGGNGQADRIARPGHPHDLLGRDVGRDQRGADGPPRKRAVGQEIAGTVSRDSAPADPLGEAEDEHGVADDHHGIER